jgi:hypothetical protein
MLLVDSIRGDRCVESWRNSRLDLEVETNQTPDHGDADDLALFPLFSSRIEYATNSSYDGVIEGDYKGCTKVETPSSVILHHAVVGHVYGLDLVELFTSYNSHTPKFTTQKASYQLPQSTTDQAIHHEYYPRPKYAIPANTGRLVCFGKRGLSG